MNASQVSSLRDAEIICVCPLGAEESLKFIILPRKFINLPCSKNPSAQIESIPCRIAASSHHCHRSVLGGTFGLNFDFIYFSREKYWRKPMITVKLASSILKKKKNNTWIARLRRTGWWPYRKHFADVGFPDVAQARHPHSVGHTLRSAIHAGFGFAYIFSLKYSK